MPQLSQPCLKSVLSNREFAIAVSTILPYLITHCIEKNIPKLPDGLATARIIVDCYAGVIETSGHQSCERLFFGRTALLQVV